ncbi:DUF4880 domain-containing protein [Vineibacter terrae]|uniref:DUF4880 domain-containing protein n=1 Tax=Vineibacter terrae TaxID=2586908 RepID=A0A5C8PHQ6_9HYPH|nr:FecR domain-containing protein [Vineibacter terrae]TXL72997.1 DUF4880 domain-containing protein [Vineibacter terrae]
MADHSHDKIAAEALQREALAWVVRLTSGAATQADADGLKAWRRRTPAHDTAFRAAVRLWQQAGAAATLANGVRPRPKLPGRRMVMAGAALAAGAAGVMLAGVRLGYVAEPSAWLAEHRTGTGEQKRVVLPDGSVAELNTRTSLSLRFTPAQRGVELLDGEASFAVTKDASRPFVVMAGRGTTTVTGTLFTVRDQDDVVRVVCVEGSVEVRARETARLSAGDLATYDDRGLHSVARADAAAETAWRRGMLVFRGQTLRQVVEEINRYRRGRIWLENAAAAQRKLSGVFHLDRLDEAITHIQRTLGLQATQLPGGIVFLR